MPQTKMFKKIVLLLAVFCMAELCADAAAARRRRTPDMPSMFPGGQMDLPRRRDRDRSREQDQVALDAADDITSKLQAVLEQVDLGGKLRQQDVELAKQSLRDARKHLTGFSDEEKCEYYLLSAWTNYFAGQYKKAMAEATRAAKQDPENQDAETTRIAMALVNGQFRVVASVAKKKTGNTIFGDEADSSRSRRGRSRRSSYSSQAILDFDPDSLHPNLLGRKIAPMQLTCLNGCTFPYDPQQNTLCAIFWKLDAEQSSEDVGRSRSPDWFGPEFGMPAPTRKSRTRRSGSRGRDESSLEMEPFAELFISSFENPNTRFLAANLDSFEKKQDVMAQLLENPWPWAQVMANDPANSGLALFARLDITEPTLAITGPDGVICYAGPVSGFLAPLLLEHNAPSGQPAYEQPEPPTEPEPIERVPQLPTDPNRRTPRESAPFTGTKTEQEAEKLYPQAENWYQMAQFHKKSGRLPMLSYKKVVDYCRLIFEHHPESPQAEKARQLLREMPEKYQKRYKVTNEEMGL